MKRKTIPKRTQLEVWIRDHWTCMYCGEPVFFNPSLKLFEEISPGHGYYHKNGKENKLLRLFQWRMASVDHIIPVSKNGTNDKDNFITACWECNNKFRNKTIEQGKPNPKPINGMAIKLNWDGFSHLYLKLAKKEDEWTRLLKELL